MEITDTRLRASDLTANIGSRIDADKADLLSGKYASEIRALLASRVVLLFPTIAMTDDEQIAFTATLGTPALENNGYAGKDGKQSAIYKVDAAQNDEHAIRRLKNNFLWHLDGSMHEVPILASILSAKAVAPEGGQTEWANTCAAYAALPEDDKRLIEGKRALHAAWHLSRHHNPEPSYDEFSRARGGPSKSQPLVWKQQSGRDSMIIGATAAYVEGMDPLESQDLLVRLRDWATQPQFVYRHDWRVGDMVMWDNTATLHRARPYPLNCGRMMHRTMLKGEEAIT